MGDVVAFAGPKTKEDFRRFVQELFLLTRTMLEAVERGDADIGPIDMEEGTGKTTFVMQQDRIRVDITVDHDAPILEDDEG